MLFRSAAQLALKILPPAAASAKAGLLNAIVNSANATVKIEMSFFKTVLLYKITNYHSVILPELLRIVSSESTQMYLNFNNFSN